MASDDISLGGGVASPVDVFTSIFTTWSQHFPSSGTQTTVVVNPRNNIASIVTKVRPGGGVRLPGRSTPTNVPAPNPSTIIKPTPPGSSAPPPPPLVNVVIARFTFSGGTTTLTDIPPARWYANANSGSQVAVASGDGADVIFTADGDDWQLIAGPGEGVISMGAAYFGGGLYLLRSTFGTLGISASSGGAFADATVFTGYNALPNAMAATSHGLCIAGYQYALSSNIGYLSTSPDGITWTTATMPNRVFLRLDTCGNTLIGHGITQVQHTDTSFYWHYFAGKSTDGGLTWTYVDGLESDPTLYLPSQWYPSSHISAFGKGVLSVALGGGVYVGVQNFVSGPSAYNGRIKFYTSADGLNYTLRETGLFSLASNVVFNGTVFCCFDLAGTAWTSPDGVTWTQNTTGVTSSAFDIDIGQLMALSNGHLVMVPCQDSAAVRWLSTDNGATWTQAPLSGMVSSEIVITQSDIDAWNANAGSGDPVFILSPALPPEMEIGGSILEMALPPTIGETVGAILELTAPPLPGTSDAGAAIEHTSPVAGEVGGSMGNGIQRIGIPGEIK